MSNEVKSVCPVCGKKFVKRAVNQKYCCTKCKRQAARKAAKSAPASVKKDDQFKANGKKTVAKVVKGKAVEKINLPKPPTVKEVKPDVVQVVCKHTIHPGDIITWSGFTPESILKYALRLAAAAVVKLDQAAAKKPAKKGKK